MKERKLKFKLEDIKVESFVTSLDDNALNGVIGGTGDGTAYTLSTAYTNCGQAPTCISYGGTCAATCNCTVVGCSTNPLCPND